MKFPENASNKIKMFLEFSKIKSSFSRQHSVNMLSLLTPNIDRNALYAHKQLIKFNPDNHGMWVNQSERTNKHNSQRLESEVIQMTLGLMGCPSSKFTGYLGSGGTESNIYLAWVGRNYLNKKFPGGNLSLLKTDLTHHSIDKACNILSLTSHTLKLNEKSWSIDLNEFSKTIQKLSQTGYKKFLLPLTLGYTLTGTSDDVEAICKELKTLQKKLKIKFYVWIDASFNGLPSAVRTNNFNPFKNPEVKGLLMDFHKTGFVSLTAGMILLRRGFEKNVETKSIYLDFKDFTLSGSRTGIRAAECWYTIKSLGRKGYLDKYKQIINSRNKIINFLENESDLKIIYNDQSLHCGVILKSNKSKKSFYEKKYGLKFKNTKLLFTKGKLNFLISRCFFINK